MMNAGSEKYTWPSSAEIPGFHHLNSVTVGDPLLAECSFNVPDQHDNQVRVAISNNNGTFASVEGNQPLSNLPLAGVSETMSNNNGNFIEVGESHAISNSSISNNEEEFPSLVPDDVAVEPVCKPFVGMEFDTIEASHRFWESYAQSAGFRARIRATTKRERDGVIRCRKYVCAKEGIRSVDQRRIYSKRRPETRCNCGVVMMVSLVKGKGVYRVTNFVEEHNHALDGKRTTPRLTHDVASMQSACRPVVGMEFDNLEASGGFWEQYAHDVGFGARIRSTSKRKKDGVVRTRTYVCSREGKKYVDPRNLNSKPRSDTRCECGALMTVSLVKEKGTYRVVSFIEEHNHVLDGKGSVPRRKPGQRVGKFRRVAEPNSTNAQSYNGLDAEGNASRVTEHEADAQPRATSVANGVGPVVLEGPLLNLTNAQRMGILCTEFMQLAYRAVGSDEVFEGVRRLIKEGHKVADNY